MDNNKTNILFSTRSVNILLLFVEFALVLTAGIFIGRCGEAEETSDDSWQNEKLVLYSDKIDELQAKYGELMACAQKHHTLDESGECSTEIVCPVAEPKSTEAPAKKPEEKEPVRETPKVAEQEKTAPQKEEPKAAKTAEAPKPEPKKEDKAQAKAAEKKKEEPRKEQAKAEKPQEKQEVKPKEQPKGQQAKAGGKDTAKQENRSLEDILKGADLAKKETKPAPTAQPKPAQTAPKPTVQAAQPTSQHKPSKCAFSIQLYASKSLDDVEEFLKSHKQLGARISEKVKGNAVWYRLRHGCYATREEAEAAFPKVEKIFGTAIIVPE